MAKKRAMITVDAEQWDMLQAELKDRGYPANSMSTYIFGCLDHLEGCLGLAEPTHFSAFFDIEVDRIGLKAALKNSGMELIEKGPEE